MIFVVQRGVVIEVGEMQFFVTRGIEIDANSVEEADQKTKTAEGVTTHLNISPRPNAVPGETQGLEEAIAKTKPAEGIVTNLTVAPRPTDAQKAQQIATIRNKQ